MKKLLLSLIIALISSCAVENVSFNVLSYNIRYDNPRDGINAWNARKTNVASIIRFHDSHIAGLQEVLKNQLEDIKDLLPEYGWYGIGRDDGKEAGEFMVILYRKERITLLDKGTFWLSETPDSVSMGWDAACFRTVTWCKFEDTRSKKVFYHFNTHFDHVGEEARRNSAKLLLARISDIAADHPVIVTGDFNSLPSSDAYRIITGGETYPEYNTLTDARTISLSDHHGPTGTWTGFDKIEAERQIDYIFVKNGVQVLKHGFLSDTFDGRFPSDHLPVFAETTIQ
ncbi:endonuclease/exonuclease/phosphatase family protein [candidate division KSB1 bacterium]